MRLLDLQLTQWRNYPSLSLDLSKGDVHLFIGENAGGKTNLLEAVGALSTTRSFLGLEEQDLIAFSASFYRIRGRVRSDAGEEETLEIVSQMEPRKQKVCFRNDVRTPASSFVGLLPTVAFLPQDLQLFTGPPAERRRFLDQILCQVSPGYFRALSEYQRLLKQRNTLLRRIADGTARVAELDTWDRELAQRGSVLTVARLELIETFTLTLREELATLGERPKKAEIRYSRCGKARDTDSLSEEMRALLLAAREKDTFAQSTTVGPHRDDWTVEVDGHSYALAGSRGQQRVCVIALLFLEASFLELRRGERPVILLDDVLSELDDAHRDCVIAAFPGHQVLLTGTHAPVRLRGSHLWDVQVGSITLQ